MEALVIRRRLRAKTGGSGGGPQEQDSIETARELFQWLDEPFDSEGGNCAEEHGESAKDAEEKLQKDAKDKAKKDFECRVKKYLEDKEKKKAAAEEKAMRDFQYKVKKYLEDKAQKKAADKVEKDDEKAKKDNKDHGFRWPCAKRARKR